MQYIKLNKKIQSGGYALTYTVKYNDQLIKILKKLGIKKYQVYCCRHKKNLPTQPIS